MADAYSSVTPIPPCSWIACWPTKRAACPICTLDGRQGLAALGRIGLAEHQRRIHRHAERLLQLDQHLGARCCKAWKRAIGPRTAGGSSGARPSS